MFTGADLPAAVLERLAAYYGASLPLCFLHPFPSPDDARDAEHADVYDPAATRENIDPELVALYDALGPPDADAAKAAAERYVAEPAGAGKPVGLGARGSPPRVPLVRRVLLMRLGAFTLKGV